MNADYEIRPEERLVIETYRGEIRREDLVSLMDVALADPEYDPAFGAVIDLRDATLKLTYQDMWSFVQLLMAHPRRSAGRWAFVTNNPSALGTVRMFLSMVEDSLSETATFEHIDRAVDWAKNEGSV